MKLTYDPTHDRLRYSYYYQRLWRYYQKPIIKVSIALLLTITSVTFFAAFAIRPTLNTIGELLRKIEDQKEVTQKLELKRVALASLQNEYAVVMEKMPLLQQALPEDANLQELFTWIEGTAAEHGLPIYSIRVNEALVLDQQKRQTKEPFESLPISVHMEATYEQLDPFLQDVTRLPRLLTVDSIKFAVPENLSRATQEGELAFIIDMQVYYQSLASATEESSE